MQVNENWERNVIMIVHALEHYPNAVAILALKYNQRAVIQFCH